MFALLSLFYRMKYTVFLYENLFTRGREVRSLDFASVSFWGRDQVIIDFFLACVASAKGKGKGGGEG